MSRNNKTSSDNKIIYQLGLNNKSFALINPYLFVEKLADELLIKLPYIKVTVLQSSKSNNSKSNNPNSSNNYNNQSSLELRCICCKPISDYQVNNLRKEVAFIADNLHEKLLNRVELAKRSVA